MMCRTDGDQDSGPDPEEPPDDAQAFSALLEDSIEDLYENAPCGYLSTSLDGRSPRSTPPC